MSTSRAADQVRVLFVCEFELLVGSKYLALFFGILRDEQEILVRWHLGFKEKLISLLLYVPWVRFVMLG
jgi:hypothetical protein